jgi:hypothetical protein
MFIRKIDKIKKLEQIFIEGKNNGQIKWRLQELVNKTGFCYSTIRILVKIFEEKQQVEIWQVMFHSNWVITFLG